MNSTKTFISIKSLAIVFTMVFGFILVSAADTSAQNRDYRTDRRDDRNRDRDYRNRDRDDDDSRRGQNRRGRDNDRYENNNSNRYRQAVQRGYTDGLRQGMADARRNRDNYRGSGMYRNPSQGYNSQWGSRSAFQNAYRQGFSRGYQDGINRYRNNRRGNNRGY